MLWLLYVLTPNPQPCFIHATLMCLLNAISEQSVLFKILDLWHVCVLSTDNVLAINYYFDYETNTHRGIH